MDFLFRLSPFEEEVIGVARKALSFGDRLFCEVFRANTCSSFSQEQHGIGSEEAFADKGSQESHDNSSDPAPEFECPTSSPACSIPLSASLLSSQDESASVSSPQQQQASSKEIIALQECSQAPQPSAISVPLSLDKVISPLKDQETSSEVLVSDALLCEQGWCGVSKETFSEVVFVHEAERAGSQALPLTSSSGEACPFERLDWGCLYHIMSFLDSPSLIASSLVSRQWLAASSMARRTLCAHKCTHVVELHASSLKRYVQVQTLKITGGAGFALDDSTMQVIGQRARHLRRLEIEGSRKVSDVGLAAVLKGCPELHVLLLLKNEELGRQSEAVSGVAFEGLRCKLRSLTLDRCKGLTNEGLKVLAAACPDLRDFTIKREPADASLVLGLEGLAQSCGNLRKLHLHRSGATDDSLRVFAAGCPSLFMVSLACERAITDAGLAALMDQARHLQHLGLTNNPGLSQIPCSRPGVPLKGLSLSWWLDVSDAKLQHLSKETGLIELHFIKCPALTDATVAKVLIACRDMRRLRIEDSPLITADVLKSYVSSGSTARLEIVNCKGVQASALAEELRLQRKVSVVRFK